MSRIVIDYNKLLEIADACRITRGGSQWIDAPKLIEEISRATVTVRASTPNNLPEIIANGEKCLKQGKRYASTLAALAAILGVTRQTLDKWRGAGSLNLTKQGHPTGQKLGGRDIKKPQYDLKAIIRGLKNLQKRIKTV